MNTQIRELFERGKQQFEGKNFARAEYFFQKILKSGGRYADVLNMLGLIHHIDGKFNNAIESFEEALTINPNYTEATLNLAVLYNDLGEYQKAKSLYSRIAKRKSTSDLDPILSGKIANMHAHLADTYREVGKYDEAIDEYKKALKVCPNFVDIRTKLGVAYRENNQKDLSIKELTKAMEQNPAYRAATTQLGVSYYSAGDIKKAAKIWGDVLAKDPNNEIVKMYLRLCENGAKSQNSRKK